jgi:HSP20 family protein
MTQQLIRRFPYSRFPQSLLADLHECDKLRPSVNLHETAGAFVVQAELPGVSEKNVKIELKKNVLQISGELSRGKPEGSDFHLVELREGDFLRAMALPAPVKADQVTAHMKNGILEVNLPKEEPVREVRVIPVGESIQTEI